MPKDTFYNLSEEKKQKIYAAAVKEFSTQRFSEASINQIVKTAEIPRGSFYQYFEGKEDVYLYMFEQMGKEKRGAYNFNEIFNPEDDFTESSVKSIRATFEWGKQHPEYAQVAILMEIDNSEFIKRLRLSITDKFVIMLERDKGRGLIRQDVDLALVGDMLFTLIWKQFSLFGSDEMQYFRKLTEGFEIIRKGIAVK